MSQSKLRILVIRHGETKNNIEHRFCGSVDDPMTEDGREFIRNMVAQYPYAVPDRIYCSPANRCVETAKLSFPGREPEIVDDLREISFGTYERRLASDIFDKPELYEGWEQQRLDFSFPGGEKLGSVRDRGLRVLREVIDRAAQERSNCIAVVSHGCIMSLTINAMLNTAPASSDVLVMPNGMGLAFEMDWKDRFLERPLHFIGRMPLGAPLPDMSRNPYLRENNK